MSPDFSNIWICAECGGIMPYCDREAEICQECHDIWRAKEYFIEEMTRRVDSTGLLGHEIYDQHKKDLELVDEIDDWIDTYIVKYDLTDLTKATK